ncbi:GNAT family N-acetyltransferase [uncultured Dietzia sp.]|uniref:GNAT family N-acetyltransferase n=1 Tax=uncultured Dietzia sp. TaxID=395519 RepID=UPI0025D52868|nr:GNAT family N-acetyltransferase [uncultured Dietzia sp.]
MVTIRPATSADAQTVAKLLSEAFRDDPAWAMSYSDPATRPKKLEAHYRHRVRRHPELADVAVDGDQVVGALLWEAPRSESRPTALLRSAWRVVQRIVSRLPGARGLAHTLAVEVYRPLEPHWYLHDIAAGPQARGKGVGSALLTHRLAEIDASATTLAALEATSPGSRRLYERFGFEAVGRVPTLPGQASTVMIRRPD